MTYFPFSEYWWFYLSFIVFVLAVLVIDLGVFHKRPHAVSFRESSAWTIFWVSLAMIFNFLFYKYCYWKFTTQPEFLAQSGFEGAKLAKQLGLEFFTGFIVEKTLAVDNLFVFAVIFGYFRIPKIHQHRVLFYGILGALFFRAIFIALGSLLLQSQTVILIFGLFLIFTGIKMCTSPDKETDLSETWPIKIMNRIFRIDHTTEPHFFTRKNGLLYVTPMMLCLVVIEFSDIIFALDSVPAIFALTNEPLIVFTSNIFAILGLRSMYFMLAGVMDHFAYIKYGLAGVLVFVGLKMAYLNPLYDGHFPISWSLLIIAICIGGSISMSWIIPPKKTNK